MTRLKAKLKFTNHRALIAKYLKETEPELVIARKGRKFKRRQFWSAGVMDVVTMDQHDKWKRFGLYLHVGLDPFPGKLLWLKIWWTVRNPHLICKFYLDACREAGGTTSLHIPSS